MTKQKEVLHPRKKVLEAIADGFREIEAHFELEGFSTAEVESSENNHDEDKSQVQDELEEDEYGDEEFIGTGVFHREDIEVAIDCFISRLVQDKIIKKIDPDDPPSLSEVFYKFFGKDHEITEVASAFEKSIKGYFGAIPYDDMNAAYGQVCTIRDIIKRELDRYA